jgi:hypothetical protein
MVLREEGIWKVGRQGKDGAIIVSVNDTASLYVTMPDGGISSIHPVVIKGHHV